MASHPDDFEPGTPEARIDDATSFSQLMCLSVLQDFTEPGAGNRPGLPNNVLVEIYEKVTLGVYAAPIAVVMTNLGRFVTTELVDLVSGTVLQRDGVYAAPGERLKRITAVPGYPISLEEVVTYRGNTVTSAVGRAIDFQCPRRSDRAIVLWDLLPDQIDRNPRPIISVDGPLITFFNFHKMYTEPFHYIQIRGEPHPVMLGDCVVFNRELRDGVSTWTTLHSQYSRPNVTISHTNNLQARYDMARREVVIEPLCGVPHPREYRMSESTILAKLPLDVRATLVLYDILRVENGHVTFRFCTDGTDWRSPLDVYCSVPIRAFVWQQPNQALTTFDWSLVWIRTRSTFYVKSIGSLGEMLLQGGSGVVSGDLLLVMPDGFTFNLTTLLTDLKFDVPGDLLTARICGGFLALWTMRPRANTDDPYECEIRLFKPRRVPVYGDDGEEIQLQRLAADSTTILHDRGLALVPGGIGHKFSSISYPGVWLGSTHTVLRSPPPRIQNPFVASEPMPFPLDRISPTQNFPVALGDWTAVNCITEEECKSLGPCQCCGLGFGVLKCSRCHRAHYCSPECATLDWPLHMDKCVVGNL